MCAEQWEPICEHDTPLLRFAAILLDGATAAQPHRLTIDGCCVAIGRLLGAFADMTKRVYSDADPNNLTVFDAPMGKAPTYPLFTYIDRAARYCPTSVETLVQVVMLLDRFMSNVGDEFLRWASVHRLFFAAFALMCKMREDVFPPSEYNRRVAGVSLGELGRLEFNLFSACRFNAMFNEPEYRAYEAALSDLAVHPYQLCRH
jgi:hypothetical protein